MSDEEKRTDKEEVYRRYSYADALKDNPVVQKLISESRNRGKILGYLSIRFPTLEDQAEQVLDQIDDVDMLKHLYQQLITISDEQDVHVLLKLSAG